MNVNSYIFRYLDSIQKEELQRKVDANESLVTEIKGYAGIIRMIKGAGTIEVDGDELLKDVLYRRSGHGVILFNNREWYNRQIRELQSYINSL